MKTMLLKKSPQWLIISILFLSLYSCVDDKYDIDKMSSQMQLTPNVAVPLASTEFNMEKLLQKLDSTSIVKSKNDTLYVEYGQDLYSFNASDLIKLPNQEPSPITIPSPSSNTIVFPASQEYPIPFNTSVDLQFDNGAQFSSIQIKKGLLKFELSSTFTNAARFVYTIDNIKTINGVKFNDLINITNNQSTTTRVVDNYIITPDYTVPGKVRLLITGTLFVKGIAGQVVDLGKSAQLKISVLDLSFSKIFGNLGTTPIFDQESSFTLAAFNNAFFSSVQLEKPKFTIVVKNSYGVGITLLLKDVSLSSGSGSHAVLFRDPITNKKTSTVLKNDIAAATVVGETKETTILLDTINTNLFSLISTNAYQFNCNFSASTKPKTGSVDNFALDTSKISIYTQFYSPLAFKTITNGGASRPDTLDVDFTKMSSSLDNINSVQLLLDATNNFPLTINISTISVIDDFGNKLLTLFDSTNKLIFKTGESVENMASRNLVSKDIDLLKKGKHLLIYTTVTTRNNGFVALKTTDNLTLKFKIKAQAKIDLK